MSYIALMAILFVLGYLLITLEHSIKLNKTASAILTAVLCWTVYILSAGHHHADEINTELGHHLASISQIIFFLLGAMTIVELVDAYQGFRIITDRITTRNKVKLLWIISFVTFFLSAVLDNLTTSIVMVSLLRKLIKTADERKFFAGIVIIAANAGGAWTPIGDVTTTMLWIGGQVTTLNIMQILIIPSLICLIIPLIYISFILKGELEPLGTQNQPIENKSHAFIMLCFGIGALLFVPVFKTITHLPPYVGILFGLGVLWVVSEVLNSSKDEELGKLQSVPHALSRVDTAGVLFFLGILLAISSLESVGLLKSLANYFDKTIGNLDVIVIAIGLASAVIDNVPLVAASMAMYDMQTYPVDSKLWEFLAYCAGTGGSILIIGSAAGVAVMGMEKIDFFWYVRRISFIALIGYFAGAFTYIGIYYLLHH